MFSTLAGMWMLSRLLQFLKAKESISLTVAGIETEVMAELPKAKWRMPVTVYPMYLLGMWTSVAVPE